MRSGADLSGWVRWLGGGDGSVIVWASLALALVLVVVRWVTLKNASPARALGAIGWSFNDSWASSLTGAGAVLGTIVGTSGILRDNADPLSGVALAGLNLFFGFLVVLSPVLYSSISRVAPPAVDEVGDGPAYQGYVGAFLGACTITLWAVFGELLTVAVLLRELQAGTLSSALSWLFLGAVTLGALSVASYAWGTIRATIDYEAPTKQVHVEGVPKMVTVHPRLNLL